MYVYEYQRKYLTQDGFDMTGESGDDTRQVVERVKAAGQGHVFRWWDELNPESRGRLIDQLRSIDFNLMRRLEAQMRAESKESDLHLEPPEIIHLPRTENEKRKRNEARTTGEALIRAGKVAAFLVAGGQGTRLGYNGPKGKFPIGPVTNKSLFQMHAEKILAASREYETTIPWYIMTSETNDAETLAFFEAHDCFGLGRENIMFFTQKMIPALDSKGRLILDAKDHVFMNPNGHGGSLLALDESGAIEDMKSRGVEILSYFQVDNVLIQIIDPDFLGYHVLAHSEMSSKMVRKRHSQERVGVFGRVDGTLRVIEYSDMSDEDMEALDDEGRLMYDAGSIAIHALDVRFVEAEVLDGFKLPYHVAHKKIPFIDDEGRIIQPALPNGYKFETFVFDALMDAKNAIVMEVDRKKEFSPVKNHSGEDSPETATRDLSELYGKQLEAVGLELPRDADGHVMGRIEISPLYEVDETILLQQDLDFQNGLYLGPAKTGGK